MIAICSYRLKQSEEHLAEAKYKQDCVLTPNMFEASLVSGLHVKSLEKRADACQVVLSHIRSRSVSQKCFSVSFACQIRANEAIDACQKKICPSLYVIHFGLSCVTNIFTSAAEIEKSEHCFKIRRVNQLGAW